MYSMPGFVEKRTPEGGTWSNLSRSRDGQDTKDIGLCPGSISNTGAVILVERGAGSARGN